MRHIIHKIQEPLAELLLPDNRANRIEKTEDDDAHKEDGESQDRTDLFEEINVFIREVEEELVLAEQQIVGEESIPVD